MEHVDIAIRILVVTKSPAGLLIVGIACTLVGIALIVFRRAIRNASVNAQEREFGPRVGRLMETTRPWAFAVVGAGSIGIGIFCLFLLFFG